VQIYQLETGRLTFLLQHDTQHDQGTTKIRVFHLCSSPAQDVKPLCTSTRQK
jgi:hypothetical protein